jgi:hypothetical protein
MSQGFWLLIPSKIMNLQETLTEHYNNYQLKYLTNEQGEQLEIKNPYRHDNILVYCSDCEYIFCFATQHAHFTDTSSLCRYIDDFLSDLKVAVEFYLNNRPIFGGDVTIRDVDLWTSAGIELYLLTTGISLKTLVKQDSLDILTIKISSWSGQHDYTIHVSYHDGNYIVQQQ